MWVKYAHISKSWAYRGKGVWAKGWCHSFKNILFQKSHWNWFIITPFFLLFDVFVHPHDSMCGKYAHFRKIDQDSAHWQGGRGSRRKMAKCDMEWGSKISISWMTYFFKWPLKSFCIFSIYIKISCPRLPSVADPLIDCATTSFAINHA